LNPIRLSLAAILFAAFAASYGQSTPEIAAAPRDTEDGPSLAADASDQAPDQRDAAAEGTESGTIRPAPERPTDPEWERARDEFVRARAGFSAMTAAALTSDELTRWAGGLTSRVRLHRAERDLRDAYEGMQAIEASGRAGTEAADRQAVRIASAEDQVARLRAADAAGAGLAVEGLPDRDTIRRWMAAQMDEETQRLADTLDTRELERRTRRLQRLTALAGVAGRFRRANREPAAVETELGPASLEGELGPSAPVEGELGPAAPIVPASGERHAAAKVIAPVKGTINSGEKGLGEATTEPPTLPPRVSLGVTTGD